MGIEQLYPNLKMLNRYSDYIYMRIYFFFFLEKQDNSLYLL